MSCVFVQLGQCGTQLGHHLIDTIYRDATDVPLDYPSSKQLLYQDGAISTYFSETTTGHHNARAVTIDMEPKVVNWALDSAKKGGKWTYPKGLQLCRKSGSGNNWSFGFQLHGPKCEEEILELLQKEAERCDHLSGFLLLMSLAGGTGSGVGSYVAQLLYDHYPNCVIVNPIVMPYITGEVAVQNYNALLTLSCVLSYANASILLYNDHLHKICSKLLSIDKVSIKDLNHVAGHQLASVLQPFSRGTHQISSGVQGKYANTISHIAQATSSHSQYKLLNLKHVPHIAQRSLEFSTHSWSGLLKRLRQMHLTNSCTDEGMNWQIRVNDTANGLNKSLGNILFVRGEESTQLTTDEISEFQDRRLYVPWIPPKERCHVWSTSRQFRKIEKSVSLLSNNSSCVTGIDGIVKKAWNMFGAKAYLHQYTKYGLQEEDFLNSFIRVENVLNSYLSL